MVAMLLINVPQNETLTEVASFSKSITIHSFRALYCVVIVLLTTQNFVLTPCCYYWLWEEITGLGWPPVA